MAIANTPQPGNPQPTAPGQRIRRIICVDDDNIFRTRLVRALQQRGLEVYDAANAFDAMAVARRVKPTHGVVDLKMPDRNGLDLVGDLHQLEPNMHIVVLTGYGSIATAVEAVRRGAANYLGKPVDTDQIIQALELEGEIEHDIDLEENIPSLARVEWEHIQRILYDCNGNISQAARKLGIHRRSLQRKLSKYPPLE